MNTSQATPLGRQLFTLSEITSLTGVSRGSLERALATGELPYKIVAGRRRVLAADLRAWAGLPL